MKNARRDNSRYIDGEVPTWKNVSDPVLEKRFGKRHTCNRKNQWTRSLFFITRKAVGNKFDMFWKNINFLDACFSKNFRSSSGISAKNGDPKGRHVPS